jgi:hypothetical protein
MRQPNREVCSAGGNTRIGDNLTGTRELAIFNPNRPLSKGESECNIGLLSSTTNGIECD